jgi:hypothetical protein
VPAASRSHPRPFRSGPKTDRPRPLEPESGIGRTTVRSRRQRRSGLRLSGGDGSRAHRQGWAVSARGSLCPAGR